MKKDLFQKEIAFHRWRLFPVISLFILFIFLLSSCGQKDINTKDKPIIYASFFPIYDLAREIIGDSDLSLEMLLPAEQDPHLWEPSPKDLQKLSQADLLIVNGANMEESWLAGIRKALPDLKICDLSEDVDLITYKGASALGDFQYLTEIHLEKNKEYQIVYGHTHEEFMRFALKKKEKFSTNTNCIEPLKDMMKNTGAIVEQKEHVEITDGEVYKVRMGHISGQISFSVKEDGIYYFISDRLSESLLSYELQTMDQKKMDQRVILEGSTSSLDKITYDPHSWLSTKNAISYLNTLYRSLSELYPNMEPTLKDNKVKLVSKLRLLHHEFDQIFKEKKNKAFVVTHYAFAYLARDFKLLQYPLESLTSMDDISFNTLRRAIRFCKDKEIKTIFFDEKASRKYADTIAWEIGGKAKGLYSMEYVHDQKKASYLEMLRINLERLADSMDS